MSPAGTAEYVSAASTDAELVSAVRAGDDAAFEELFRRYHPRVAAYVKGIVRDEGRAEDVTQEAFLALWRSGARYERTRGSVRTWVLGIVHNRAIDALRRSLVHDRRRASDDGLEERVESGERTDVEVARREDARNVRAALDTLPAEQSRVIELAYFGGFSHSRIADMLDMPIGTVKGRMRLGLEKMRGALVAREVAPG